MSGSLKIEAKVDVSGALADGRAEKLVSDWQERTAKELGGEAAQMLREFPMNKSGRSRGGFAANINPVLKGASAVIRGPQIEGVTWAPWLEGTSSRNASTGFKGYRLFRKTRLKMQKRAVEVGQEQLDKIVAEMGGG